MGQLIILSFLPFIMSLLIIYIDNLGQNFVLFWAIISVYLFIRIVLNLGIYLIYNKHFSVFKKIVTFIEVFKILVIILSVLYRESSLGIYIHKFIIDALIVTLLLDILIVKSEEKSKEQMETQTNEQTSDKLE